jgi:hypothetical protein
MVFDIEGKSRGLFESIHYSLRQRFLRSILGEFRYRTSWEAMGN